MIRRHSDGYVDTDARPYVVVTGYDADEHRTDQLGDFEEVRKPTKKARNRNSSVTRSVDDLPSHRVPVRVSNCGNPFFNFFHPDCGYDYGRFYLFARFMTILNPVFPYKLCCQL